MANVSIYYPVNMHNVGVWYGTVTVANASEIIISNGALQGTYTGNFSYDPNGNVSGTLTGMSETISGALAFSASGLSVPANQAAQLINSNQIQSFFQTALSGNDQFTVTPGTHVIDGYGGYNT